MARPKKCRRICCMPEFTRFEPAQRSGCNTCLPVILTVDEYEAVRLIDYEGRNQDFCSKQMSVARTTVQAMYDSARKKISECLVEGRSLLIEGGEYVVCGDCGCMEDCPAFKPCCRRRSDGPEDNCMKIAVTYDGGNVFGHFGKTENFKIFTCDNGKITSSEVVSNGGNSHGALAGYLKDLGVTDLICGGIGQGAKTALENIGIKVFAGAEGSADERASELVNGTLKFSTDANCNEHGEHHTCNCH